MPITTTNNKKKALLAYKEKLLQDIMCYEKRIEDFCANASSNTYFEESSSGSEDDFPPTINVDPSLSQLRQQQAMLQTCLHATQELTGLEVLQSEVNVLVKDPVIDREPPVNEPGTWHEVTAECCIDLVPFSITFYVHQPSRKFAATSYRSLVVLPVKRAHEAELSKSVLPGVTRPSDAIEVLRSYAAANRSRRTTLARLADKFAHHLFMEPMAEGGYLLKCANVLELSWRLENKRSPLAAFHHRMSFDLEYLDESYIKIITQAHKQLSDPSIQTDERTLLLATIITTCLEAQGNQDFSESMGSDNESVKKVEKRPMVHENEAPVAKKKKDGNAKDARESEKDIDGQMMAPPKSLPKKVKPKGKENLDENRKSVKRSNPSQSTSYVKKTKTDTGDVNDANPRDVEHNSNDGENVTENHEKLDSENTKRKSATHKKNDKRSAKDTETVNKVKKSKNKDNSLKEVDEMNSKNTVEQPDSNTKSTDTVNLEEKAKKKANTKEVESQKAGTKDKTVASAKNDQKSKEVKTVNDKEKQVTSAKNDAIVKKLKAKNDPKNKHINAEVNTDVASSTNVTETAEKDAKKKVVTAKNAVTQKVANKNPNAEINTDVASSKNNTETFKKVSKTTTITDDKVTKGDANKAKNSKAAVKSNEIQKNSNKNSANAKNDKEPEKNTGSVTNKKIVINKESNSQNVIKNVASKDTNIKSVKASKIHNAVSNKDTDRQKNNTKDNPEATNANKVQNMKSHDQNLVNPPKIQEQQKNNIQKSNNILNQQNTGKNSKIVKNIAKEPTKNARSVAPAKNIPENSANQNEDVTEQVTELGNVAIKNKEHIADRTLTRKANSKNIGKTLQNKLALKHLSHKNSAQNKLPKKSVAGNINAKPGNIGSGFKTSNTVKDARPLTSKIPQKKLSPISESGIRKNPLRISPRKTAMAFKSTSESNIKVATSQKLSTNIPRLLKKPETQKT